MSYYPWGQRRDAETGEQLVTHALLARPDWQQTISGEHQYGAYRLASIGRTTRGFTGHEMLDEAGLIHMNGRLYDPLLGRFVQADPFVQAPDHPDSYDRYAYVLNNPLSATDPTGYISSFFYEFKRAAGAVAAVVYTAACVSAGACDPTVYAAIAAAGAIVAGADGEGILLAAVTAYVGGQIGGISDVGARVAAAATLGGVTAAISGGSIGHSMVSAGIGALFGGSEMAEVLGGSKALQVGMAAIVGGTQSELTGGKFVNGAGMAGFMALVSLDVKAKSLKSGGDGTNVEYFEEDGLFDQDTNMALKVKLKEQAAELSGLVDVAKAGEADALSILRERFGSKLDLGELSVRVDSVVSAAKNYPNHQFRKLSRSHAGDDKTLGLTYIDGGPKDGNIYLSKTAYDNIMAGNKYQYTLIHELMHQASFAHTIKSTRSDVLDRPSDNYGEIYAYQSALEEYYHK